MPALGLMQKPIIMPAYPHMLAEDTEVWTEFLRDPPFVIKGVWYDVHVGQPISVPGGSGEMVRRLADGLGKKRIDAVLLVGDDYYVVEIKPFAGTVALGQVITYRRLFEREFDIKAGVIGSVVCRSVDPDLVDDFEAEGIVVITV